MSFEKLVKERFSCRHYHNDKPLSTDIVESIINTANLAPSACNAQPYTLHVVRDHSAKKLAQARSLNMNDFIEECSTFIVIAQGKYNLKAKLGSMLKRQNYRAVDIGIVAAHVVLAAKDIGVDSCILGMFNERKIQRLLKTRARISLVIALGYGKHEGKEKERKATDAIAQWHA